MKRTIITAAASTMLFLNGPVSAQDYNSYVTVKNPELFEEDWTSFYINSTKQTDLVKEKLPHALNLPYGDDPKQKLDVYMPKKRDGKSPVLLFLHGGGFVEGDKAHYGFIAEPYADIGAITVVASYRLTGSGAHYPAQPDDVRKAIQWIYHNIARYGGDPERIVVSGHSAGAILAGDVGASRCWMKAAGVPVTAIKAIVGVSGRYALTEHEQDFKAYVPDLQTRRAASPFFNIADPVPRMVIAVGGDEAPYLQPSIDFDRALHDKGVDTTLIVLPGADHQGAVNALAKPGSPLFEATAALLR